MDQRKLPRRQPGAVNRGPCHRNRHFFRKHWIHTRLFIVLRPALVSRLHVHVHRSSMYPSQLGLQIAMLISLSEADRLNADDEYLGKIRVCFRLDISLVFSRTYSLIIRDHNVGIKYPVFLKRRSRIHGGFPQTSAGGVSWCWLC
jgi:hypothetical protein